MYLYHLDVNIFEYIFYSKLLAIIFTTKKKSITSFYGVKHELVK